MNLSFMPHLNAALNALACTLLVAGRIQIQKRQTPPTIQSDLKVNLAVGFAGGQGHQFIRRNIRFISLNAVDENGVKEYAKLINYGVENNLPNLKAAYLQFYEDKLLDLAGQRARTAEVNHVKQTKKAGIVSQSTTPSQGQSPSVDISNVTYDEITDEAKAELAELMRQSQA